LEFEASVHDLINPPNGNRGSNIQLKLTNTNNMAFSNTKNTARESIYSISLLEPSRFGLNSREQHDRENFTNDLVLACNLTLNRGCITRIATNPHITNIENDVSDSTDSVERNGNLINVRLSEPPVIIGDHVSVRVTTTDIIDEVDCLDLFKKIRRFNRFRTNLGIRDTNLASSLKRYVDAMNEHELLLKFQFLFNSLENIININGTNFSDSTFDNQVNTLSGINSADVADWRKFYNRIRHVQSNPQQLNTLRNGEQRMTRWILMLRQTVATGIRNEV